MPSDNKCAAPAGATRKHNRHGFSLVEVLAALFLLSCTAMVFGIVYPSGARARVKAEYYARALAAAQEKIENCRYEGYTALAVEGPIDTPVAEIPNGNLRYIVTDYDTDVKKIDIVVTWDGTGATSGVVRVATLMSDHG